tara:strand:+ start:42 stop:671 length:630 start_codon:yes stop_codon:yes gene_type:complete
MAKPKDDLPDLKKEISRWTATVLNEGVLPSAEDVVRELQFKGPSWTGLYSNSWQIQVGNEKATGTRRQGEPKPIKAPKMNVKSIREGKISKDEIRIQIRNLARSRKYAQDEKLGRFRRGKVKRPEKNIGQEPKTSLGQGKLKEPGNIATSGRKGLTKRGDIGGGTPGVLSSRTAPLDWFKTFTKGGTLDQTIKLELGKAVKKGKRRFLK